MKTLEKQQKVIVSRYGRPTVMTNTVLNKLQYAFCIDATDREACAFAGISEKTLYNYQRKNPDFLQQKQAWKSALIFKARQVVANKVRESAYYAFKYLERKRPQEFASYSIRQRYKQEKEHKPVEIIEVHCPYCTRA